MYYSSIISSVNTVDLHWLLFAFIAAYLIMFSLASFLFKNKRRHIDIISLAVFIAGIIVTSFFLTWDVFCIIFFIFALIIAITAVVYIIIDMRSQKPHIESKEERAVDSRERLEREVLRRDEILQEYNREIKKQNEEDERKKELEEALRQLMLIEERMRMAVQAEQAEEARQKYVAELKMAAAKKLSELGEKEAERAEEERQSKRLEELMLLNASITAKHNSTKNIGFKLSREDVLDRIEEMAAAEYDYPVEPNICKRDSSSQPDLLKVGIWTFAMMYETGNIIKFMARMSKQYAQELKKLHPTIEPSVVSSDDWYKVIIDTTYYSKAEVFAMLDNWYMYTFKEYWYNAHTRHYETDLTKAKAAEVVTVKVAKETVKKDEAVTKAAKEQQELEEQLQQNKRFEMSKQDLVVMLKSRFADIEIIERKQITTTGLPIADTYYTPNGYADNGTNKRVCFAHVYQLKDDSLKIIAKLPKIYAENLSQQHSNICRSKFPVGKNWYVTVIDSSYVSAGDVYSLITRSKAFVESTETRD